MIYDCFLYNDETSLLEIRLRLLAPVVDRFVIVFAAETFTGLRKEYGFPHDNAVVMRFRAQIELIELSRLEGSGAWDKERFQRNGILAGLKDAHPEDIVLISDIDEVPRPSALLAIGNGLHGPLPLALGLDYFNFKLNYKMIYGMSAVWVGPVAVRMADMTTPQQLRERRWGRLHEADGVLFDAGWHFSYLTSCDTVYAKLKSFSHQERYIQERGSEAIPDMINRREGFHSHVVPGSVWAIVATDCHGCPELERLILEYPALLLADPDPIGDVERRARLSINRMSVFEHEKMARLISGGWLCRELLRRLRRKIGV